MTENKFEIICKVKGTKIKSQIEGLIETNFHEMDQGQEDFHIIVKLNFDPDDIPEKIKLFCNPPEGFDVMEPIELALEDAESADLQTTVKYKNAPVGFYTIEGRIEHEDFGTELGKLEASFFNLKIPELKIRECSVEPKALKRGDKFEVTAVIRSAAPQKIKGTISGKLKPTEESTSTRVYELETQKISVKGERTVDWSLRIPHDEEDIGEYSAEYKFDSKEMKAEAFFKNVFKLKRTKDVKIIKLEPDENIVSPGDTINFKCGIKNIGIERTNINLKVLISPKEGTYYELPVKDIELNPDEELDEIWSWQVPENAKFGTYQVNLIWEIPNFTESNRVPGDIIELRRKHEIDIKSISTDKDYYLSGQKVGIQLIVIDTGTRAGKKPMDIKYRILSSKKEELLSDELESTIIEKGTEVTIDWLIPEKMSSGSFDFEIIVSSNNKTFVKKKSPKLINIEQPIVLHFKTVSPKHHSGSKMINKYMLEGEDISGEEKYHELNVIKLNSRTKLLKYENLIVGGANWNKARKDKIRTTEDLFFSYLMLHEGMNIESISDLHNRWDEQGRIWCGKFISICRTILEYSDFDWPFTKMKDAFESSEFEVDKAVLKKVKNAVSRAPSDLKQWKKFVHSNESILNIKQSKKSNEILRLTNDEKYGTSNLNIIINYLDNKKVKGHGRMPDAFKNYIKTFSDYMAKSEPQEQGSISKAFDQWLFILTNPKIMIETDDEIAFSLDLLYSFTILRLIVKIVEILKKVTTEKKITMTQYMNWCIYTTSFHILYMENLHNKIKYNRFMDEELCKEELTRHMEVAEQSIQNIEDITSKIMSRYWNYWTNMELRTNASLLIDNVKLDNKSKLINGFMGEHIRKKFRLINKSKKRLNFNMLIAFPSDEWHLLEPDTNLIDGIYWHENISIPPSGKYEKNISIAFPKALAFREYYGLIKFEPIGINLLDE